MVIHLVNEIPGAGTWRTMEEIQKGWSVDKKYYVEAADGRVMLLRMSDISRYDRRKLEFESVKKLDSADILMSRPIDFGVCNQGRSVYSLFTWVEGEDAREIIPLLSMEDQYRLGVDAGKALRLIHEMDGEHYHSSWADYYNAKIDRYIQNYQTCGIHIEGAEEILRYIEENRHLLEGRPMSLQHGDYHVGNMIITNTKELGIIDFNRLDFGDPWEEFNRITWCSEISGYFASGRINGYFNDDVPDAFFRLMALYIACNQIGSVHWAIPFGEEQVDIMLDQAKNVFNEYNGFRSCIPSWYGTGIIFEQ
ncbi:Phosphotransferase enzyme family protein [compost metagenome]